MSGASLMSAEPHTLTLLPGRPPGPGESGESAAQWVGSCKQPWSPDGGTASHISWMVAKRAFPDVGGEVKGKRTGQGQVKPPWWILVSKEASSFHIPPYAQTRL